MLQGINKQKLTVFVILGSVFVKLILNIPLIMIFHTSGAVLSTAIALMVANVANLMILKVYAKFHFTDTLVQVAKIFIYSLIMMISVEVVYLLTKLIYFCRSKIWCIYNTNYRCYSWWTDLWNNNN